MGNIKVTRELHSQVRKTLETMGIMSTARYHNISPKTVSRINRGGSTYMGYKRKLIAAHESLGEYLDMPIPKPKIVLHHPTLIEKFKKKLYIKWQNKKNK